ncbi:hypothetical protein LTR65_009959 [Meristemomyces frigidus]
MVLDRLISAALSIRSPDAPSTNSDFLPSNALIPATTEDIRQLSMNQLEPRDHISLKNDKISVVVSAFRKGSSLCRSDCMVPVRPAP